MTAVPVSSAAWLGAVRQMIAAHNGRGAFAVVFPDYRPDLVLSLAHEFDFQHFDFRAEIMAPLAWQASRLELDDLDHNLQARLGRSGLVAQNVEALLATKAEDARRAWLLEFLERGYPAPVIVPIVLYPESLPCGHGRTSRVQPADLPTQSLLSRFAC